jgi:NAD(P)-dependent dehydrogenase (short-subunit alcohol dehydrogenase family)
MKATDMKPLEMFDLAGKTVLVTGASRGIGKAIAQGVGQAGADVAVLARSTDELNILAKDLQAIGRTCHVVTCDVSDALQIENSVESVISAFGHLDVLINNAGGISRFGPFLELESADWEEALSLDLRSVIEFSRIAGRHMVERGSGSIINITATLAAAGAPMVSHYAATKSAVATLTRSLGAEWAAAGVRVNALSPGWIVTSLTKAMTEDPQLKEQIIHAVPDRQWRESQDIVGPAIFLASDASRFVNGTTLFVDGGLSSYGANGPTFVDLMPLGRVAT